MANVQSLIDQRITDIVQQGPQSNWRQIVTNLVDYFTAEGKCFSSGEIAAIIRTVDSNVVFSVTNLGHFLRDQFFGGQMPMYVDPSTGTRTTPVLYVPRTTTGTTRSPAGVEVFVYAPDASLGMTHDFEVDIPAPQGAPFGTAFPLPFPSSFQPAPALPPAKAHGKHHNAANPVQITGSDKAASEEHRAVVQNDGRCRVGRHAFEALLHKTGKSLAGGQPVYLSFQDCTGGVVRKTAVVTIDQDPNIASIPYSLSTWNGEIRFISPNGKFTPGDEYEIIVTKESLVVDLSKPLSD